MNINFVNTKKILIALMLMALVAGGAMNARAFVSIGKGILHILGIGLTIDPEQQTTPINMGTAVNTNLVMPDVDLGDDIPVIPEDFLVVAELTGPGITEPITIAATPGEQLMIPPLPEEGTYALSNIRLMSGDNLILYANPSMALIDTLRKLLITQVTSRALSIDEIEALGITINPENFTAYKFTVGFATESGIVEMEIPVVMDRRDEPEDITNYVIEPEPPPGNLNPAPSLQVPNLQIGGIKMAYPETETVADSTIAPPISGAIVIPGDIAFLNQFFEIILLLTNNAPDGTSLTVTDISAEIFLPAGDDNIPNTPDDPLRIAQTQGGASSIVPIINTTDDGRDLRAQESGEGKFLVEGLREGTHRINIDITGTLLGLPSGPVQVAGKAVGTVIVRNPYFSLAFGQPDVVREGEEYSLFVVVNNTSEVAANLASLTLPPGEVYGATMVSDSDPESPVGTVRFRTIDPGDSAVAEFRLISRKTGRVTSAAFAGDDGVNGVFQLRTGVDERGVPLSPDTIILSRYVKNLPEDLVYHAMRVLGLAHGAATAPVLPPGVTRIPKNNVAKRAYELTEAGLRVQLGEPLEKSIYDFLMDWLGNGFRDKGFEEIMRTTDAGEDFLLEAGRIIGTSGSMSMQRALGDVVKYRSPFISAVLENTGQVSAYLEIIDNNNQSLGRRNSGSAVRDIPFGVLIDLDGNPDSALGDMVLLDSQTGESYDLRINGVSAGNINFGLILPDGNGGYIHAQYTNISITAGETITGRITAGAQAPVLQIGSSDINPSSVYAYDAPTGPKVISAMQLSEADMRDRGRVVAVLFDEKIQTESANDPDNYQVVYRTLSRELINPPKLVKVLTGGRIILVMFQATISPFFEYDLILSGITDPDLNPQEPDPARVPIITTLTNPGGIVSGTVRKGNGDPIPYTDVLLWEVFIDSEGSFPVITNRTVTDEGGNYQLDYVAAGRSFRVESSDPETGQKGHISSRIIMDRQHLQLDILLLGLGTLTGQVVRAEDESPVEGAVVTANSLTSSSVFYAETDADGRFSMSMVPVGNINLTAEKGYYKGSIGATIPNAGAVTEITVPVYSTLRDTGSVRGRVFETDSRTPVEGVPVIITGNKYRNWMYTDTEGNYLIEDVPAGEITAYTFRQETGEEARATGAVQSNLSTTMNLVFPGTATIIGTVYNYKGEPVQGADVLSGVNLVQTDENGNFVIDLVPIGSVTVTAYDPESGESGSATVHIGSPGEVVRVNITFPPPTFKGTIQGYVKDAYGQTIAYHQVIFWTGQKSYYTSTDSSGFFTKELPLGSYSVRIRNSGGTDGDMKSAQLAVDGQTATLELKFKGFGRVTGTVYQPDGESPAVASVIFARTYFTYIGTPYTAEERHISDQLTEDGLSGKYTIENVRVGDFRLRASNAFYSDPAVYTGRINSPGETAVVDIILQPTSTVSGQVFLANGDRAGAGLPVTLRLESITEMQVTTIEDGTFEFNLVPPEKFTLEGYNPLTGNYGIARGSVETGDGAVVDVHILGKGTVNVTVIDGAGDPISDARVELDSGSKIADLVGEFPILYTDPNGEAVFNYVPEGRFSVTAEDPRTLTGGRSGGTIPEDLTEINVTVVVSSSGTVYGTVITADETGTVPYAQVKLLSEGRPDFFTTSDADGNYTFTYVPLGSFSLEVFHPGTARVGKASGAVNYDTQQVTVDIILIAQGTVEGYVYTATGEPVAMAEVKVGSNTISDFGEIIMTSNLEGRFKVSGIPEGEYTVKAHYAERNISGMAEGSITFEGELVRTDVYLEATGTVYGRTLSANGITPMPYAEVNISGRSEMSNTYYTDSAVTDSEGNFSFSSAPVGIYSLTAMEQNGFDGGFGSATVDYEGHLSEADIIFIGTGNIIGRVVNADGTPLEREAKLTLRRTGLMQRSFDAYTDLDGNFAFYGIPTGELSITAKIPGSLLGGVYTGVLSEDGETLRDVVITIDPSGEINGSVLRQDGITPVQDALVTCRVVIGPYNSIVVYAVTDEAGVFACEGLPFGQFDVNVTDFTSGGNGTASGSLTETASIVNLEPIILDENNPYIVNITPASGSVQVPLDSVITIEFSEPVASDSVYYNNIKVTGGTDPISGDISLSDDRTIVTFVPLSDLPEFTPVTVTVNSIKDDMGKTMEDIFISTFTTADITSPSVLSARLINGAFLAEFSEPVVQGSGMFSVTYTDTGEPVEGLLTFSAGDMVATLYPSVPLPDDTSFDILISGYADSFGNVQADDFTATYMTGDEIPPVIILTSSASVVIGGTPVTVTAIPQDSPDIYTVDFRIQGQIVETVNRSPFAMTMTPIETVTVTAIPTDYAGNIGQEVSITIEVIPNAPPSSSIISPEDGAFFGTGSTVMVSASATDDLGLKEIEMRVRSTDVSLTQVYIIASDILSAEHNFYFTIPSTSMPGMNIDIEVVARDIRDVESAPASITIQTEDTTRPVVRIISFTRGFQVEPSETIPVNVYATDNSAVSRIDFRTEGGLQISETQVIDPPASDATASFTLAIPPDYAGGTQITIAPSATDISGNVGYAPRITLVVEDVIPPAVEILTPADGSSVMARDTVRITASASDNDVIDRVEFFIDGQLFATDRSAYNGIYEATFTAPAEAGTTVILSVRAYDRAGNSAESASVTVTVVVDNILPEVAILSNLAAMRFGVGHVVDIRVDVTDNIGISSAELLINNSVAATFDNPGSRYLTFSYLVEDLIPVESDSITVPLEVRAADLDGNTGTSGVYDIKIIRDTAPAITILTPQSGQNVLGGSRIRIQAESSDDFGIASFEIRVNGITLAEGSETALSIEYDVPESALGSTIVIEAVAVDTLENSFSETIYIYVPLAISDISALSTNSEVTDVVVYGSYAYILEQGTGISVIDVSDVSLPVIIASLTLQGDYTGMDTFEGVIYVYGPSGIMLIDTADPFNPAIINSYETTGPVADIAFRSGYAYCAMGSEGLLILDVHDPAMLGSVIYDTNGAANVDTEGDYLYITHGDTNPQLSVYSLTEPLNPVPLSSYSSSPFNLYDSEGDSGIGITGNNRLISLTFDEVSGFSELSDIVMNSVNLIKTIDLKERYAIHSSGTDGWGIVEVYDNGGFSDMGLIPSGGSANKAVLHRGYVYTADGQAGLRIYRIDTQNTVSPEVQITSPVSGSSVEEGSEVEVTANVDNGDNASVTFLIDNKEVFTDEAAPYIYRFRVPRDITSLVIKARADNLNGLSAESTEVVLNVIEETVLPSLTVTSPVQDGTVPNLFEGETLIVEGYAVDDFGIDRIELFIGGVLVDYSLLSSFDLEYIVPDDGVDGTDYLVEVIVRATDVSGNISEVRFDIRVIEDNPPQIYFITPQPDAEVYSGIIISLNVSVIDDRTIEEVRFYEGGTFLGTGSLSSENVYSILYRIPEVIVEETRSFRAEAVDYTGQISLAETSIIIKLSQTGPIVSVGDDAQVIDIQDDIAVTGGSNGVLNIYNIGVPTSPVLLGSLDTGTEEIRDIRIEGSTVYAASPRYFRVIDITDTANPVQLSAIDNAWLYSIDVFDDIVFLGRYAGYLRVYDVGNGQSPVLKSTRDLGDGNVMDVKIDGMTGMLYAVVDNGAGSYLSIIDDIEAAEIGRVSIPGSPRRLDVNGDKVYIANSTGMVVVDVSDPTNPTVIGSIDTPGTSTGIEVMGNWAYVADGDAYGLSIVDITIPEAPLHMTSINTPGSAKEVALAKGLAFIADGLSGITVVEIGDTPPFVNPDLISITKVKSDGTVDVIGEPMAVIDEELTISLTLTNLNTGITSSTDITSGAGFIMSITAVTSDDLVIEAFDTYQGSGPVYLGKVPAGEVVGNYPVSGFAQAVDVDSNIAVIGDDNGVITVFDVTDPLNPVELGSLDTGTEEIRDIRIEGSTVYAASPRYFRVIDITDTANPVQLSATDNAWLYSIDVFDDIVFLGRYAGLISVYDVGDGQSPVGKSTKDLGNGNVMDVKIDGMTGILYAVVDNGIDSYLSILNPSNPTNLVEIGRLSIPENPESVMGDGDKAYIIVRSGLLIVSLDRLGTADFGTDGDSDGMADDILSYKEITGGVYDVGIKNNYAYLANGVINGIRIIDITDSAVPNAIAKISTPGDARELKIKRNYAYVADGSGLTVVRLYTAEVIPTVELELVRMEVDIPAMTVSVVGLPGAVSDNAYPLIVRIESAITGQVYETQVQEADNGAFTVSLPWIPGDELYISLVETTTDPLTIGPFSLGMVPAGEVVSSNPVSGFAQAVDVDGNIAVIGDDNGTLTVFDITNPLNPVQLGSLDTGNEEIRQIRIEDNMVYAAGLRYFRIIDITDTANPVQLSATDNAWLYSIDVFDDIVFLGRYAGLISVYDVGDGQSPVGKSTKDLGNGNVMDVKIDGMTGILYAVVDNGIDSYLSVLDAMDVTSLVEIGKVTVPVTPRGIEVAGDNAYIAVGNGMVIVSLARLGTVDFGTDGDSDGMADDILSYIATLGDATGIGIKGNYAYIADGLYYGATVFDITDPNAPVEVGNTGTPGNAGDLKVDGGYLYVADGYAGLSVILSHTAGAVPTIYNNLVSMEVYPSTSTMEVIGYPGAVSDDVYPLIVRIESTITGQIYETQVQEADNGVFTVSLPWIPGDELNISLVETTTDPLTIGPFSLGMVPAGEVVSSNPVSGFAQAVDVDGNIAVIGDDNGTLTVFDITNPLNPVQLGSLDTGNEEIRQIRIEDNMVYAAGLRYFRIIDITDTANPVQLSATDNAWLYSIDVFDDIVFLGRYAGLISVYDVGDGQSPVGKSTKDLGNGNVMDVKIDGMTGILYAVVDNGIDSYLSVLDAMDVTSLVEIGKVTVPVTPRGIEVAGDNAYIAVGNGMVIVSLARLGTVDFGTDGDSDGMADDILSYIATLGDATGIGIKGNYAYIADGLYYGATANGVDVFDITDPLSPVYIAEIDTLDDAVALIISGSYAYAADGYAGLSVIQLYTAEITP